MKHEKMRIAAASSDGCSSDGRSSDGRSSDGWRVRVEPTAGLLPAPVWTLDEVRIGPGPRDPVYEEHLDNSVGSSVVRGDEWRFDTTTRRLVSLIWRVPEGNGAGVPGVPPPDEVIPAALVLEEAAGEIGMPAVRVFTPARLVCGLAEPLVRPRGYRVAPGLTVLAQDGAWWGWSLDEPLAHLPGGPGPAVLTGLVETWFRLVSDDTMGALEDADPALGAQLRELHARALALGHVGGDLLAGHVSAVLETFWPESPPER